MLFVKSRLILSIFGEELSGLLSLSLALLLGVFLFSTSQSVQDRERDVDYTAKSYGTKSFTPDPESEGFVAFESLTESDVVGWFTEEETAQIESVLDADLEAQAAPQVISGLPW